MPVIAMTREMGSLGKDVAAGLAERLGLEVVHHELVERGVAERLDAPESEVHRFLEGSMSFFERWKIDTKKLSRYTAGEILELAKAGNVLIRGWGATHVLRAIPHVRCVRLCAPMESRARVLMKRLGIDDPTIARREIERNDAAYSRTMHYFFDSDWADPLNYDIVLNTMRVPVAACVAQIAALAESLEFQENEASQRILTDKLIESRVRAVLDQLVGEGHLGRALDIVVDRGRVTLSGAVFHHEAVSSAEDMVRDVGGVTDVDNKLVAVNIAYGP